MTSIAGTNDGVFAYEPRLLKMPDGRRAAMPLFNPVIIGYVSLMLGSLAGAALAVYNAIALRRARPLVRAVFLGGLGWLGFLIVVSALWHAGLKNPNLAILAGRLFHLVVGILLGAGQVPYVRGHAILGGGEVPFLPAFLGAFALTFVLPPRIQLLLLGLPT